MPETCPVVGGHSHHTALQLGFEKRMTEWDGILIRKTTLLRPENRLNITSGAKHRDDWQTTSHIMQTHYTSQLLQKLPRRHSSILALLICYWISKHKYSFRSGSLVLAISIVLFTCQQKQCSRVQTQSVMPTSTYVCHVSNLDPIRSITLSGQPNPQPD